MTCKNCKYYEPERNPETGRPLPSKQGRCVYEVDWPDLPDCFMEEALSGRSRIQYPYRRGMWPLQGEHCKTWEQKDTQKRITKTQGNDEELDQNALF